MYRFHALALPVAAPDVRVNITYPWTCLQPYKNTAYSVSSRYICRRETIFPISRSSTAPGPCLAICVSPTRRATCPRFPFARSRVRSVSAGLSSSHVRAGLCYRETLVSNAPIARRVASRRGFQVRVLNPRCPQLSRLPRILAYYVFRKRSDRAKPLRGERPLGVRRYVRPADGNEKRCIFSNFSIRLSVKIPGTSQVSN